MHTTSGNGFIVYIAKFSFIYAFNIISETLI